MGADAAELLLITNLSAIIAGEPVWGAASKAPGIRKSAALSFGDNTAVLATARNLNDPELPKAAAPILAANGPFVAGCARRSLRSPA